MRLSRELAADAIAAGDVASWRKSNARRHPHRKPYRPRRLVKTALVETGQRSLFPELDRPVSRLRDFYGGRLPPLVAIRLEFYRRRRGLTQAVLAALIGIRQPHYANAIRGHDPLSPHVVRCLRALLLTGPNRVGSPADFLRRFDILTGQNRARTIAREG